MRKQRQGPLIKANLILLSVFIGSEMRKNLVGPTEDRLTIGNGKFLPIWLKGLMPLINKDQIVIGELVGLKQLWLDRIGEWYDTVLIDRNGQALMMLDLFR